MRLSSCAKCDYSLHPGLKMVRFGRFYRTSDSKWVQRFRCTGCKRTFSEAMFNNSYRQKKRLKNQSVVGLLCSGVSQRRVALLLKVNRKTVVNIFRMESAVAEARLKTRNLKQPQAETIEFDDLETFELTKCKPLSVTLAVEYKTRRILGLEVSRMPANGMLAAKARELYGPRSDERRVGRRALFRSIAGCVQPGALIKSDQNPHYPSCVAKFFPNSPHQRFRGKRGAHTGQGEIKKVRWDPLFSLNHTCAMLRANVNRLVRKTWCTTKQGDQLRAHLYLYADFHNSKLIAPPVAKLNLVAA